MADKDGEWKHDMFFAMEDKNSKGNRGQQSNRGNNSNSGNNTNNRARSSEISDQVEQGVVCSLKEAFGFLESCDRENDLFFHYTELPPEVDSSTLKIGTEVEYTVAVDRRSGKQSAVRLKILPQGTVSFEEISQDSFKGVIGKELVEPSRGRRNQQQDEYSGIITAQSPSGATLSFAFGANDLEVKNASFKVGDEVEFKILLHKKTKKQTATNIKALKLVGERETGIVHNLVSDKGYGFINCCDRNAKMWFHFSELMCQESDITVGTEVEFTVTQDKRSDKASAIRVIPLKKGTVSFETILEGRYKGTVEVEPLNYFDKQKEKKEEEPGVVVAKLSEDSEPEKLQFRLKDLSSVKYQPRPDDEVEFSVLIDKRTKKKFATKLTLIKSAPEVREQGVVVLLKKTSGVIASVTRVDEITFQISDFTDQKKRIELGQEVDFAIIKDVRSGKFKAVNINLLPKGSVSFEDVETEKRIGTVTKEGRKNKNGKEEKGTIQYEVNGQTETISFSAKSPLTKIGEEEVVEDDKKEKEEDENVKEDEDKLADLPSSAELKKSNYSASYLLPGDKVEFNIAREKRTSQQRAVHLKLVEEAKFTREKGYVCKIKGTSIVIRPLSATEESKGQEYRYFFGDDKKSVAIKKEVKLGQQLEFGVLPAEISKTPRAVRLEFICADLITFEDITEGLQGVVKMEQASKRKRVSKDTGGQIVYLTPTGEKEIIEYTKAGFGEKGLKLKAGEVVDFSIAVDKITKAKRALNIKRGKQKGIVKGLKPSYGFIERYDKLATEQLFFHVSELPTDASVKLGDEVEFYVVYNDKKEDLNAQKIVKTRDAKELKPAVENSASSATDSSATSAANDKQRVSRKVNIELPAVIVLRNPKMPEGKGFVRTKFTEEERKKLVEANTTAGGHTSAGASRLVAAAFSNLSK